MNRFQIRDILKAHQQHFRVLPTGAMLDLRGIINSVNAQEEREAVEAAKKVVKKVVKKKATKKAKGK